MMDFNKLNYMMAIAELQSFSKAAKRCFVSQPALTRCVKNIEDELGLKLFDRSCSPIKLTYAGERYIAVMQEILELKTKLDQEMEEIAQACAPEFLEALRRAAENIRTFHARQKQQSQQAGKAGEQQ